MQSAAPELMDLKSEKAETLAMYGVDRTEGGLKSYDGGGAGEFSTFARNCLLAHKIVSTACASSTSIMLPGAHHLSLNQD